MIKKSVILKIIAIFLAILGHAVAGNDSGGVLLPQQAAYDVTYYALDLKINPEEKTISGSLIVKAKIVDDLDTLVLDLDQVFTVDSVFITEESGGFKKTSFYTSSGKIFVECSGPVLTDNFICAKIYYHGVPRIPNKPPWDDGFVWGETSVGKHWIGVTCEGGGADIWWPCKDHPSDEPDSVSLRFTVPTGYLCVSNGKLIGTENNDNGTSTFNWFVSTPINNYDVTFYLADYLRIDDTYLSVSGDTIPFNFWILPESYEDAQKHLSIFFNEFHFLEMICGPFPFGTEKHGFAHAPYWGMEHQTIVAYGSNFEVNTWGLDYIHFHELAHEWWGNLVTAKDWSDVWIHEGLATYMEALYVEHLSGRDSYQKYLAKRKPENNHNYPLASKTPMTASDAFDTLNPYNRGAWAIHTLRYYLGDKVFYRVLKYWAYPDTSETDNHNGKQCRLVTTDDMKDIAEKVSSRNLTPFFDVFFREASYPYLEIEYLQTEAKFTWITENNVLLDVDVPVMINDSLQTVDMRDGHGRISLPLNAEMKIDPEQRILMGTPLITRIQGHSTSTTPKDFKLFQNYPNPFNEETQIGFSLPVSSSVEISVHNTTGEFLSQIFTGYIKAGTYWINWKPRNYPSGVYYVRLQAEHFIRTIKTTLVK